MDKYVAIKKLEPIASTCVRVIEDGPSRFHAGIDASLRRDFNKKAVSVGLNSVLMSQLAREIPRGAGFSVGEFGGLPGIMDARGEILLRVKQLDKKLNPMNISTGRQKNLQKSGVFELNERVSESLILGFRLSSDMMSVTGVYLFQNKDTNNKEWIYSYRLERQRPYLDLFDGSDLFSITDTPTKMTGTYGAANLPQPFDLREIYESERQNAQLTDLPEFLRIRSSGDPETKTGTDKD